MSGAVIRIMTCLCWDGWRRGEGWALARVANMFSRCWKLEATSQTLECCMADGYGWWQPGTHISDIPTLHSICQTSTKCQFLISVFIPPGKLFLCLLVCSVAGVGAAVWPQATCPLLTQISPAQGRAGPRLGWPPSRTRAPKSRTSTGRKTVKVLCKDNTCKHPILILDPDR